MMEMNETVELEVLGGILEDFPTKDATANSSVSSEELQKVSIKRGKGRLVQDGARISRGVKGKLKVNIKVTTISEENFKEIVHQVTNTYRGEHYEQLEERARHNEEGPHGCLVYLGLPVEEVTISIGIKQLLILKYETRNFVTRLKMCSIRQKKAVKLLVILKWLVWERRRPLRYLRK